MKPSILVLTNMNTADFNNLNYEDALQLYEYGRKKANKRLRDLEKENLDFASSAYRRVMEYYDPHYLNHERRSTRVRKNNKMEGKLEFEENKYLPKDIGKLKSNLQRVINFLKSQSSTPAGQRKIEERLKKEFIKNFKVENLSREELSKFWEYYDRLSNIPGFQALKNKSALKYRQLQETAAKVYLASGTFKTFSARMEKLVDDMERDSKYDIDDIVDKYAKRSRRTDRFR